MDFDKNSTSLNLPPDLRQYFEVLMASTAEGIIGIDNNMCCIFANRAASDILGFSAEEMRGKAIRDLIRYSCEDSPDESLGRCVIQRSVQEKRSFIVEQAVLKTKENDCVPVQFSSNPIFTDDDVSGAVLIFRNVSETLAMASHVDYLASHDALTGLVNRYEFEHQLAAALNTAKWQNEQHVLCYMDLDQFKLVNDTCGHIAGDDLLKQLSAILLHVIRSGDVLARLGGDEFGILLKNCNLNQAQRVAEKLQQAVREFRFQWEEHAHAIGSSIGIVEITGENQDVTALMSIVDSTCYLAKEEGRNRIYVYHPEDQGLVRHHGEMLLVSRIQKALENDLFQLNSQRIAPIVHGQEKQEHIEILLRMLDEDGALILPKHFIPAAERYNLMPEIDRWVIRNTFDWLSSQMGLNQNRLCAINLSGQSLGDESFLGFLIAELQRPDLSPASICFEITETTAVANFTRAVHFIKELKALGCRFALDDFGSGMSSFTYLKKLPVDFLKIDGNLVKDIAEDPVNYGMVEAINRVGGVMGVHTIAEFVENQAILDKLRQMGVDYAQGFGIGEPEYIGEATYVAQ